MSDDLLSRIEYDPDAPDVESIMRQVRALLGERNPDTVSRSVGASPAFDGALLDELRQAQVAVEQIGAAPYVAPSTAPIVGGLLDRVRLEFHRLVVFYVSRLAGAQSRFNRKAVDAVEELAAGDAARIARLEAQVAALEARLAALERADERPEAAETTRG